VSSATFGFPTRPTIGQALVWNGRAFEPGSLAQAASALTGLTLNRVPFGNTLGGLQDSANLTFDGTTLALTGAQTISSTLTVSTLTSGRVTFASTAGLLADSANLTWNGSTLAIVGAFTATASSTVNNTGGQSLLNIGDNAASSYSTLRFFGGSAHYNFQVGAQVNLGDTFEITPSDVAAGTAFSTPALAIAGATRIVTLGSTLIAAAATTSISSIRIPHGAAPSSPTNGDMWTTTAGLYVRINGATVGPLT
jgi:hypothetical protein